MEKLEVDSKSGSDEEFYDCIGKTCDFSLQYLCFFSKFSMFGDLIIFFVINYFVFNFK